MDQQGRGHLDITKHRARQTSRCVNLARSPSLPREAMRMVDFDTSDSIAREDLGLQHLFRVY
jgi:hypothetical protein